jgi:carbonic anhydrase
MAGKGVISMHLQKNYEHIFENNHAWATAQSEKDPEFFKKLTQGQSPECLWIGCSDSHIPAEQVTSLEPSEVFVHRNITNLVCNINLNVMSVINYAVRHLSVKHIIVCGHYSYGGVKSTLNLQDLGLLNPWLRNIRDVYRLHESELDAISDNTARYDRLVELNVIEQCRNIIKTAATEKLYTASGFPIVSGWVFRLQNGLLRDLRIDFQAMLKDVQKICNLRL